MIIDKKHIILFWILGLILFTFYCIFRIKHIREKYDDIKLATEPKTIIAHINNIQKNNKITDMPGCSNVYDDNIKVQEIGYNDCQSAYIDYLHKNLNINNKYESENTLAEICPVSSKSEKYSECLKSLLNTNTNTATIVDNINIDMVDSINNRINERSNILHNIETALNPFIYSKVQNDFRNNMIINDQIAETPDDALRLVDNYYHDRYSESRENFTSSRVNKNNNKTKTKTKETFTNSVDPQIEKLFFGSYKPIPGQFLALSNLIVSLEYDTSHYTHTIVDNKSLKEAPENLPESKPVMLSIRNDDLFIVYTIRKIDNYKLRDSAVEFILKDKNIINQKYEDNIIDPLLTMLGLPTTQTKLIMIFEEFTSTEGIKHSHYKIVNENLDTLLVLQKLK